MGNTAPRTTNVQLDLFFQDDLQNFIYEKQIGQGKFMKSHLLNGDNVYVVSKVYMSLIDEVNPSLFYSNQTTLSLFAFCVFIEIIHFLNALFISYLFITHDDRILRIMQKS